MNTRSVEFLRRIGRRVALAALVLAAVAGAWALVSWLGWAACWAGLAGLALVGWVNAAMALGRTRADLLAAEARIESLSEEIAMSKLAAQIGCDRAFSRGRASGLVAQSRGAAAIGGN